MADRLTQLQDCLDQLTFQMLISLHYISQKHPWPRIQGMPIPWGHEQNFFPDPSDPYYNPDVHARKPAAAQADANIKTEPGANAQAQSQSQSQAQQGASQAQSTPQRKQAQTQSQKDDEPDAQSLRRPNSPDTFNAELKELAVDLVQKQKQIELLIRSLPGIGSTKEQQENRIRELEEELGHMDEELREAEKIKAGLVRRVEDAMLSVRRV